MTFRPFLYRVLPWSGPDLLQQDPGFLLLLNYLWSCLKPSCYLKLIISFFDVLYDDCHIADTLCGNDHKDKADDQDLGSDLYVVESVSEIIHIFSPGVSSFSGPDTVDCSWMIVCTLSLADVHEEVAYVDPDDQFVPFMLLFPDFLFDDAENGCILLCTGSRS
jgi:hypothetical protein